MDFLKKNKIIVGLVLIIVVALAGVLFFVLRNGDSGSNSPAANESQTIKQIQPEDIGLALELSTDKKNVTMTISKLTGIKSVEYELSYDAEETVEGETSNVPKGAISSDPLEVKGQSSITRKIFLGTCSAVCRPDKVTSDIKVLVRVNYENGEVGAAEATVPFGDNN